MSSPESNWSERVYTFLHEKLEFIWYIMKLSVIFLLFSLPIITAFASYGAVIRCIAEMRHNGYQPIFRLFWQYFKADGLKNSAVCAACAFLAVVLSTSGTYYFFLTAGSALQYLTASGFAFLAFLNFSFFLCFPCINSLVCLPLHGVLSNTFRYILISIPANIGLLLALCAVFFLVCLKPFLLVFAPLLLCFYGWLTLACHEKRILYYMTAV